MGRPIIAYAIEAALKSKLFDEVMVSTDDDEIKRIAIQYGAQVPFKRNTRTAGDHSTTFEVMEEVITNYNNAGKNFDRICCLYPCAPFVTATKLTAAYNLLTGSTYDTVFPVVPFGFPIQRAVVVNQGRMEFINSAHANTRSQDLQKTYHDTGQFYFAQTASLLEHKSFVTANTGAIIVSEMECQDIDEETDWKMAELKFRLYGS